jgi:hypothetical protein
MYYSKKLDTYVFDSVEDINIALTENVIEINNYIYNKIKSNIDTDFETLVLFYVQLEGVLYNVKIRKNKLLPPLKKCLSRFEELEEYDKCIECRDLIAKIDN